MTRRHNPAYFINNLDLIRLVAALQVVLFHTMYHLGIEAPFWLRPLAVMPGVPIFFVISGFLVSASFERRTSLLDYARKRALRILPALWVCVVVTAIIAGLFGFAVFSPPGLAWIAAQFVGAIYTPGFLSGFGMGSYNGSLWTIPVELQFYLLLPFIYMVAARFRAQLGFWAVFLLFLCMAVIAGLAFPGAGEETALEKLLRYSFVPHVYLFAFGVLLQRMNAYLSRWIVGKGLFWLAGYLAIALVLGDLPGIQMPLMLMLGITTISLAYTAPATAHSVLKGNDISYGVYIYHGLVINVLIELGMTGSPTLLLVVFGLTIVAATASWFLVEKPALRGKAKKPVMASAPA